MKFIYPEGWSSLEYPWQRVELMSYLEDAGKPDIWKSADEVGFFIHFFFDDHDFSTGENLLDEDEVIELVKVTEALDLAISVDEPMSAELWKPFADRAVKAYALLAKRGVATLVPD